MKSFVTAINDADAQDKEEKVFVDFEIDGREMRSQRPHEGQLMFLMASMGRGMSNEARFSAILNVVLQTLSSEDADYISSRLMARDPEDRISPKTIQDVFEYLTEEWFANPTQSPSDSAPSPQSVGQSSTPTTTPSPAVSFEPEHDDS